MAKFIENPPHPPVCICVFNEAFNSKSVFQFRFPSTLSKAISEPCGWRPTSKAETRGRWKSASRFFPSTLTPFPCQSWCRQCFSWSKSFQSRSERQQRWPVPASEQSDSFPECCFSFPQIFRCEMKVVVALLNPFLLNWFSFWDFCILLRNILRPVWRTDKTRSERREGEEWGSNIWSKILMDLCRICPWSIR